jgi:hypothetical protein
MSYPVTIAFDFDLMRPGCAIVQRALGGTISNEDLHLFDDWLTSPTPAMRLVTLHSEDETRRAAELSNLKGVTV